MIMTYSKFVEDSGLWWVTKTFFNETIKKDVNDYYDGDWQLWIDSYGDDLDDIYISTEDIMYAYDRAVYERRRLESALKASQKNLEKTRFLLKQKKQEFKLVEKECKRLKKLCETNGIQWESRKKRV